MFYTTSETEGEVGTVIQVVPWPSGLCVGLRSWRSRIAEGLPTGYSLLDGNLTGFCYQQYRPRLDNGTHRGLCWKQVVTYQVGTFVDYPR